MTKPIGGKLSEQRKAGAELRVAVLKQLRDGGPQTALQVHAVLGGDPDLVAQTLYRALKAGIVRSARGPNRSPSTYSIAEHPIVPRDASRPFRPVLKEWAPICARDPLVCFLFGAPAMRAA